MIPVISIDYAFMGSGQYDDEGNHNPLLIMEDDTTKMITAHMVPREGPDEYSVNRLAQDIKGTWVQKGHTQDRSGASHTGA